MNAKTGIIVAGLLLLGFAASSVAAAITGVLTQCANGCNASSSNQCVTTGFTSGQCFALGDGTPVSITCGQASSCLVGTYYTSMDCSGPGTDYAATCDGTCGTVAGSYTYWQCASDGSGVKIALACGDECANCVAVSPVRAWGTCIPFPGGSVRATKQQACQAATMSVYPNQCTDIPRALLNEGTGTCTTSAAPTSVAASYSISCAGVAPPPPPPTTPVPPGATTAAPMPPGVTTPAPTRAMVLVTRAICSDLNCKMDCRPFTYPGRTCEANYQTGSSFTSECPAPGGMYIVQKHWPSSLTCSGNHTLDYDIPGNCMVQGNSSYYVTCRTV